MDPNPLAVFRTARQALRTMKQHLVDTDGIGADIPLCFVTLKGNLPIGVYEAPDSAGAMAATIYTAVTLSDCDMVLYCGEVYLEDDEDGTPDNTALCARFASGDPRVKEAVAFTAVHRSGRTRTAIDPYRYEGRTVIWEPHAPALSAWRLEREQALRRSLSTIFEHQAQRDGPAPLQPGTNLVHLGTRPVDDNAMIVSFAMVQPCPCGTGRPMGECCSIRN